MIYEELKFEDMQYIIRYPDSYEQGGKYPVIFAFHGAGGRGDDISVLRNNPYYRLTDKHQGFPFVTVSPLCSKNTWLDHFETVKRLVIKISGEGFTDKKRMYAMGASMGGYMTWALAMSMPEFFAAIVPICGGGMYWNAGRLINVPVWAFHGGKDGCVFPEESEKMVNAVNDRGGNAKLTVYPENGHDAWSDTYKNIKVFEWLLENENSNIKEMTDIYNNSEIYG